MTVGEKIYELRFKRNISQETLALELGVSRQSISKWETNQANPDLDKLVLIANYFNVSIDYLLGYSNEENHKSEEVLRRKITKLGLLSDKMNLFGIIVGIAYLFVIILITGLQNPLIEFLYGYKGLSGFVIPFSSLSNFLLTIFMLVILFILRKEKYNKGSLLIMTFVMLFAIELIASSVSFWILTLFDMEMDFARKLSYVVNMIGDMSFLFYILLIIFIINITIKFAIYKIYNEDKGLSLFTIISLVAGIYIFYNVIDLIVRMFLI